MNWSELQGYSPTFWLVAIVCVYLSGISKSGFAGGPGVLSMPILTLVIDPRQAAAILLPLLIFMDMFNLKVYRRDFDASLLKSLVAGSVAGIVAGALCFSLFQPLHIKLMIGVLAIWFALRNLFSRFNLAAEGSIRHRTPMTVAVGSLSGFTSFIAHAGGPPITGYLLQLGASKMVFLGTAAIFFSVTNLVKLPAYALIGQVNLQVGAVALLLTPAAWFGVRSGLVLKDKLPDRLFRRVMNLILLLLGFYLVAENGWALLGSSFSDNA